MVEADLATVTVLFYDNGTLKTYSSEYMYIPFLHEDFSRLPAQAISCDLLYNVRLQCTYGDIWKESYNGSICGENLSDSFSFQLLSLLTFRTSRC